MALGTAKVPTALESTLMSAILEHHDGPLNVDWQGVAQAMGYKSGQVASDRFRQVKRKLGWVAGVRVNKGTTTSKSNVARARAHAKPRAAAAKKPAAKKATPASKGRVPGEGENMPKYVMGADEEGKPHAQEEKKRDFMAPSDSEGEQEIFMQGKVARDDFGSYFSGAHDLPFDAVGMIYREMEDKELQNQIAQEIGARGEPIYEKYDTYRADAVEDALW